MKRKCPLNGDANHCETCVYSVDYYYNDNLGECVRHDNPDDSFKKED